MGGYNFGKSGLKIRSLREKRTVTGTGFLIYGDSGSRKTRTLGTLPGVTCHLSMDNGANSAEVAREQLGRDGQHQIVSISSLADLKEALIVLKSNKAYKDSVDTVVIDSLVEINTMVFGVVSRLPRYNKDTLHAEDITETDPNKNADGKKVMALYGDVQKMTAEINADILELRKDYNVVMLAGEVLISDASVTDPGYYHLVNGPKSIRPFISLYDEVYKPSFDSNLFDSKDEINTKFSISTYLDTTTGAKRFAKTRNITTMDYLSANEIPADFEVIFKETGYITKKTRKTEDEGSTPTAE
jgi:hypothetical protein